MLFSKLFFNVCRCIVGFLFTAAGIVGKTMLTIGMHDTMHQFMDKDMNEYWEMVSNDTFLKESLIRGILSTMFLVLGWTSIGLIAKTAIFSFTNISQLFGLDFSRSQNNRKRRETQPTKNQSLIFETNQLSHIERSFPSLSADNPALNDYLIERSLKTIQKHQQAIDQNMQLIQELKNIQKRAKKQNLTS